MRFWVKGYLAALGLMVGLAAASASAQDLTAMDNAQWHRLWAHFARVQQQIDLGEQSGVLTPTQAWNVQKELQAVETSVLFQHFERNGTNHYDVWGSLHRIHKQLGGAWEKEFDRY